MNDEKLFDKFAELFSKYSCGDNSCIFRLRTGGMGTNGGCRCLSRESHWFVNLESGTTNWSALKMLIYEIRMALPEEPRLSARGEK